MLQIDGLSKNLGSFCLSGVSLTVEQGDYFVLLGESGAGKTVILELISGLLQPDAGTIHLDDKDLSQVRIQDRGIGLVYQDHALFPHMSVRRNIAYPLGRDSSRVDELAEMVGAAALLNRNPKTLSLGEAQRVALARTLATDPRILLLDEPLASLDIQAKADIRSLLRKLNAGGQTIIHVTHDYQEALALACKVAVLEKSRICQIGTPEEVFHHPKTEFVANFVGIKNFFHGRYVRDGALGEFVTDGVRFSLTTDAEEGDGFVVFENKDVIISLESYQTSARNCFKGTIVDMEPIRLGVEVAVDIGVQIHASITKGSIEEMGLKPGLDVWVSFKSTAIRYIED